MKIQNEQQRNTQPKFQMDNREILKIASVHLNDIGAGFVLDTGRIVERTDEGILTAFMVPEALDPDCVVDPPEIWVLVSEAGERVEFVRQH